MSLSRRRFLCSAACFPAAVRAAEAWNSAGAIRRAGPKRSLMLDCSCMLKESLEGYAAGFRAAGLLFESASPGTRKRAPLIVVPAASLKNFNEVRWLRMQLENGALALVESGAAFLSCAEFGHQRFLLRSELGVTMLTPVKLWGKEGSLHRTPYIDFNWPITTKIRDFSRLVPLRGEGMSVVAQVEDKVVAIKRRVGSGALVFLGSPVGPQILAGDREAQLWFNEFCDRGLVSVCPRGRLV